MIIERHGERIDLAQEVSGVLGSKYGNDQMAAYMALTLEQSYIDYRDADEERGDDNGSGAVRFGRRIYSWDDHGFHYWTRHDTIEEAEVSMLERFPLSFDETVEALEALPVVVEQLAGFGIELSSFNPREQLTNVLSLGFVACDALQTVAHDWGHYQLAAALNKLGYRRGLMMQDDESWLVGGDQGDYRPMTDSEIARRMEAMDGDSWRWAQLATIGAHFYRADSEAEAVALVDAIGACLDAAKLEGVEL